MWGEPFNYPKHSTFKCETGYFKDDASCPSCVKIQHEQESQSLMTGPSVVDHQRIRLI